MPPAVVAQPACSHGDHRLETDADKYGIDLDRVLPGYDAELLPRCVISVTAAWRRTSTPCRLGNVTEGAPQGHRHHSHHDFGLAFEHCDGNISRNRGRCEFQSDKAAADDGHMLRAVEYCSDRAGILDCPQIMHTGQIRAGDIEAPRLSAGRDQQCIVGQHPPVLERDLPPCGSIDVAGRPRCRLTPCCVASDPLNRVLDQDSALPSNISLDKGGLS